MKKPILISVILAVCVCLSACGAVAKNTADDMYYYDASMEKAEVESENGLFYSYASSSDMVMSDMVMDSGSGDIVVSAPSLPTRGENSSAELQEEKLVYTSNITLETEDFDSASSALHAQVKSYGGIIVSENAYNLNKVNSQGMRTLSMTVRIPQEHYDAFISGLSDTYNVASIHNSVDNLTEYYYDNENRLKSYRIQEERLFAMLEQATTVEEMLKIEDRLCEVQYQIENLTNTQKSIDNDVKYATFYLNLNEVTKYTTPAPKTFGDRLGDTVKTSGESFAEFLEGLLFAVIFLAPYIIIIAVILIIVLVCVKRSKKKKARKAIESGDKNEEK